MEELDKYLCNIDFEQSLKKKDFFPAQWNSINKELEYLFFWERNQKAFLWTPENFSEEYCAYVEGITGTAPKWTNEGIPNKLWWGQTVDEESFEKEKILNSKVVCAQARKKLGLEKFSSLICEDEASFHKLSSSLGEEDVIKSEFDFSGRGIAFNQNVPKEFPVVIEPWVKRVRDFSLFEHNDEICCIQTQINQKGTYKGSLFKSQMSEKDKLVENFKIISDFYKAEYGANKIQLDSFQFLKNSQLLFQFLGEVNHRRTLGTTFYDLHKQFGNRVSFLGVLNSNQLQFQKFDELLNALGKFQYNPVTKSGGIPLSPGGNRMNLFFFTEESERTLQFLIRDIWKKIVKSEVRLPPEFIVYL